jgi:hypothetical protein
MPYRAAGALVLAAWFSVAVQGQQSAPPLDEPRPVAIPYVSLVTRDVPVGDAPASAKAPRFRMFNMPSGFLVAPLGIDNDDDGPTGGDSDPLSCVQFNLGMYNPNFDLRLPGDPGGLGYYKLYSQLQLLDQGSTSICVDLQAYTPAGYQFGGVANGPTTVNPALSWFQELGGGTALQGYVGQRIQANSRWQDNLHANFQYGMALQYPLPLLRPQPNQGVYVFVQALGRYRYEGTTPAMWEILPGVHWRMNENCWMSLGVSHYNFLTWSWQF